MQSSDPFVADQYLALLARASSSVHVLPTEERKRSKFDQGLNAQTTSMRNVPFEFSTSSVVTDYLFRLKYMSATTATTSTIPLIT